jgi:hypothetical protein
VIVELVLYFISFRKYPLSSFVLSEIPKIGFTKEKTINGNCAKEVNEVKGKEKATPFGGVV